MTRSAGAGAAAGLLGDLRGTAVEDHDVVLADGALLFVTEDVLEVHGAEGDEGDWPGRWGDG